MRVLVTGSSGHLGEGLVRTLRARGDDVVGLDLLASPYTDHVGSVADAGLVRTGMRDVDAVIHAATLHKPHVATHSRQAFIETNVTGTLAILEAALECGVGSVVFSSTTSVFGATLSPAPGKPAAWITEDVECVPKNIYGVTKRAAEDLCQLFHRTRDLSVVVLRVARFFLEEDDDAALRQRFTPENLKANEYLHRRLDLADAVDAHLLAVDRAPSLGFGRYIVSATTPFSRAHVSALSEDAGSVVRELFPDCEKLYAARDWHLPSRIDRVYDNDLARQALGWQPRFDFASVMDRLARGEPMHSELALAVGSKGYHPESFDDGPYPVEGSG